MGSKFHSFNLATIAPIETHTRNGQYFTIAILFFPFQDSGPSPGGFTPKLDKDLTQKTCLCAFPCLYSDFPPHHTARHLIIIPLVSSVVIPLDLNTLPGASLSPLQLTFFTAFERPDALFFSAGVGQRRFHWSRLSHQTPLINLPDPTYHILLSPLYVPVPFSTSSAQNTSPTVDISLTTTTPRNAL